MATRAMWKGVLTFGVVSIPVKLYSAIKEQRVQFNLLHSKDLARVKQQMVCSVDNQPVDIEHQVRGFEIAPEQYVLVKPEELEALEPEASRLIEIVSFIKPAEIDPRLYDRYYYLGPDGAEDKYATLEKALTDSGTVGICRWVMRKMAYTGALQISNETLSIATLRHVDELVEPKSLEIPEVKLDSRELQMAQYLIDTMAGEFHPEQFKDEYQAKLRAMIDEKAHGKKIKIARPKTRRPTQSNKLISALEASIKNAQSRRAHA
jgi:DNA end-binding protein Ku